MKTLCLACALLVPYLAPDEPVAPKQQQISEVVDTQKLTKPLTTAREALAAFDLPDGFSATVFAAEPDVRQPIAMTFDHRGRLWVVENYTYGDIDLRFDRSVNDRVLIFEDTDHDGVFDNRKIFWDQSKLVTGIEIGLGGVWLTAAPEMVFIPDRNRDDIPDGPAESVLTGFDDQAVAHNIVNGLRWGPEGWLYGRHGILATSHVGLPGSSANERQKINCGIWRYHPLSKKFEVVAHGSTNPWGWDYNRQGEMFMINTVIGHLFHVVPGARYTRMYGSHFNPHTYQVIQQTADHVHWAEGERWWKAKKGALSTGTDAAGGGHAHSGLMIYQGASWPSSFDQALITLNFHGRRLNQDHVRRAGNSYTATHGKDIFPTSDPWFRGVELRYGPDGNVFVLDWSDIGECHENDGIHRSSGRIYKFCYGSSDGSGQQKPLDLGKLPEAELLKHFLNSNQWWVRAARRELVNRHHESALDDDTVYSAERMVFDSNLSTAQRLAAVWFLYSIDRVRDTQLIRLSAAADEHLRVWAVRLLTDGLRKVSTDAIECLRKLAVDDSSELVRLYIASGLNRLPPESALEIAALLANHEQDANDRAQPCLIWYRIEPLLMNNCDAAIELARHSRIPVLRRNIVRRMVSEIDSHPAAIERLLEATAADSRSVRRDVLRGMTVGLEGWARADRPASWPEFVTRFERDTEITESERLKILGEIDELNGVFGDGRSVASLLEVALDRSAAAPIRRQAILSLGKSSVGDDDLVRLKPLLTERALALDTIKTMIRFDSPVVSEMLLASFETLHQDAKSGAIDTLTARPKWSADLLDAIADETVNRSLFTAWHARQVISFGDEKLDARLASVWGAVRKTSGQRKLQIAEMAAAMTPEKLSKVDLSSGQRVFEQVCGKCHRMFGKGGKIGPDLTGANRANLNYLLENILDPGATLATSFRSSVILLDDGRLVTGVVVEETDRVIGVQTKDEIVRIDKTMIEERRQSDQSLMPEGLLAPLSQQQQLDLIGWLMQAGQ